MNLEKQMQSEEDKQKQMDADKKAAEDALTEEKNEKILLTEDMPYEFEVEEKK